MFKRIISMVVLCVIVVGLFSGCLTEETLTVEEEITQGFFTAVETASSVKTSVLLDMTARVGTSASSQGHTASISSDITIYSTSDPFAYHSEYYSQIFVDGVKTREDQEFYAVLEDGNYVLYEADPYMDNWTKRKLPREEVLGLPLHTGLIHDWQTFLGYLELEYEEDTLGSQTVSVFMGEVPSSYIQEIIGEDVFGSWIYSMEQLLEDTIPCTFYINKETKLPAQIEFSFSDSFLVSDMIFENSSIIVSYTDWNDVDEIEVPRKVSVIATDEEAEFYLSYFAWDLFLPYIVSQSEDIQQSGDTSFSSSWNTFELRLDGYMMKVPLNYKTVRDMGYIVDDYYSSVILEPYSIIEDVPVLKNNDVIRCTFYNADTSPQPITSCTIGSIDIKSSDIVDNGIKIFLPGELTLGVTRDFLLSAYGDPDVKETSFSVDTYLWKGETENQFFYAEVSANTGLVIRFEISNVPFEEKTQDTSTGA